MRWNFPTFIKNITALIFLIISLFYFSAWIKLVFQCIFILAWMQVIFHFIRIRNIKKYNTIASNEVFIIISRPEVKLDEEQSLTPLNAFIFLIELSTYQILCLTATFIKIRHFFKIQTKTVNETGQTTFYKIRFKLKKILLIIFRLVFIFCRMFFRFIIIMIAGLPYRVLQFIIFGIYRSDKCDSLKNLIKSFFIELQQKIPDKTITYSKAGFQI